MLDSDWTAEVVGRMHTARVTRRKLAAVSGYNASYISTVLSGRKGSEKTKKRIIDALEQLESEMHKEPLGAETAYR